MALQKSGKMRLSSRARPRGVEWRGIFSPDEMPARGAGGLPEKENAGPKAVGDAHQEFKAAKKIAPAHA